jgi:hypothetical protein
MREPSRIPSVVALTFVVLSVGGCAPEVGSEAWCAQMEQTSKSDWSLEQAAEYARSCVIPHPGRPGSEKWCNELRQKPPADWSANDAKNYAAQCLLR